MSAELSSKSCVTPAELFFREQDIPTSWRPGPLREQREYLVNGFLRIWPGALTDVFSPIPVRRADRLEPRLLGRVPSLARAAALEALAAARAAYDRGRGQWPTLGVAGRAAVIREFAHRLASCRAEMVLLLMWETAKSRAEAEAEFERTLRNLDEALQEAQSLVGSGEVVPREGISARCGRAPRGVALCLGPCNHPLNETFATLIPALLMGNTVVLKPPRYGVLLFRPLLAMWRELLPPGVVNVIYGEGDEVLLPLMRSGDVDALAFIGSPQVGQALAQAHPRPLRLKTVMGLGAKNAAVVLPGADLQQAARECLLGALAFNGQRCTALKILFVHRDEVSCFVDLFLRGLRAVRWGMPWQQGVWLTPLIEPHRPAYLRELLADALRQGAHILNPDGGAGSGPWFPPTVVSPVTSAMRLWREEQFGPLVPIVSFDCWTEVEDYLDQCDYAQQISLFARDAAQLEPLVDPLVNQVGRVNLNCKCQRGPDNLPFGGRKDSAVDTLSAREVLTSLSLPVVVAARDGAESRLLLDGLSVSGRCRFFSED
ncbi:MAG: aldehyde dehydrogenase family protein [Geoalkalibacter sp.]|uniref:aldehyde dehydrogenase family protein n=1 Tax=Geoalkalibacter sp. TaxID=3041440 RepID=UPI003D0CCA62